MTKDAPSRTAPISATMSAKETSEPASMIARERVLDAPSDARRTIELAIPNQLAAIVVVPGGGKAPRPVLVASHGAWDRPEWYCDWWGELVADRAFVLCPRGRAIGAKTAPENQPYFYPDHHSLEREVLAGLAALRLQFGERVDPGPVVYTGFSQGAAMGALVVGLHPEIFTRAIFIEGGHQEWPPFAARLFARGGGQRVLFACGTGWCWAPAREQVHNLERAGIASRLLIAKGAGHTPQGQVGEQVREAFSWVVEGDPRWSKAGSLPAKNTTGGE